MLEESVYIPSGLAHLINSAKGIIGKTVSTEREPNTSEHFWFWLSKDDEDIQIGNMVCAKSWDETDLTFGVVVEMKAMTDVVSFLADFLSHDSGNPSIVPPTDIAEVVAVRARVVRNLSGKTRPLGRSLVYFPSPEGIQFAVGQTNREGAPLYHGIPVGVFENGDGTKAPIKVDESFVLGPNAAHFNISGISGLAAKTSCVLFLLKSLQQHTTKRVAYVLINVKSRDLLYIDRPNPTLEDDEGTWSREAYESMGIAAGPFEGVHFFAPATPHAEHGVQSLRSDDNVGRFCWPLSEIKNAIPSLISEEDWDDKMEALWGTLLDHIEREQIVDYPGFLNYLIRQRRWLDQNPNQQYWNGHHRATFYKMVNRLQALPRMYEGIIATTGMTATDLPFDKLTSSSIFVIDIQQLDDRGQQFVFNRIIQQLTEILENRPAGMSGSLDAILVFVDELNKFAPAAKTRSPLKAALVDITARGRSLGLVLFGAEQFASGVDKQIIDNCATYAIGRTEAGELCDARYRLLSDEEKSRILKLSQGEVLMKGAKFSQPLFLKFPYPPCITGDQVHG